MTQAYQQLTATFTRLHHMEHLQAMASWDMMTMMPAAGGKARSEALAELDLYRHALLTDKRVENLLQNAKEESLDEIQRINLLEMERTWQKSALLPAALVEAKTLAGARCEQAWRQQRPANDWRGFAENLREVVTLSREEARIYADAFGCSAYDALLTHYEPGMTSATLDSLFQEIKTWLPGLIKAVTEKQARQSVVIAEGPFAIEAQKKLSIGVMSLLNFDFNAGRLDVSAHPFCGGVPDDVRITTRYKSDDLISAMMGVIHETGHARYEQNLPKQWSTQPLGKARSTAIHESQSLFFEKQLGRSEAFLSLVSPLVCEHFGQHSAWETVNFTALNQRVQPGLIRVDADEVSYPAHIIVRYEIEKALIEGDIEVEDIPRVMAGKNVHLAGY
ncbi:MAG: Thermostable carboxypeptidase 1 [Candidatus Erwinia impunctatus]|nr:Thermostable carboxypeptidase 1 [Culicoides impunctatus]